MQTSFSGTSIRISLQPVSFNWQYKAFDIFRIFFLFFFLAIIDSIKNETTVVIFLFIASVHCLNTSTDIPPLQVTSSIHVHWTSTIWNRGGGVLIHKFDHYSAQEYSFEVIWGADVCWGGNNTIVVTVGYFLHQFKPYDDVKIKKFTLFVWSLKLCDYFLLSFLYFHSVRFNQHWKIQTMGL